MAPIATGTMRSRSWSETRLMSYVTGASPVIP
jgi:hypothetical protein